MLQQEVHEITEESKRNLKQEYDIFQVGSHWIEINRFPSIFARGHC